MGSVGNTYVVLLQREVSSRSCSMLHLGVSEGRLGLLELTPCLERVNAERGFVGSNSGHSTAEGEWAVAECLNPSIRENVIGATTRRR